MHAAHQQWVSAKEKKNPPPKKQTSITKFGTTMNANLADEILIQEIEAICARFEPIERLFDHFVVGILVRRWGSVIIKYLPTHATIFQYVERIDRATTRQITEYLQKTHGTCSLAVDGVTINGTSLLLYALSKGDLTLFTKATKLGSLVHVRDAEVSDCIKKLEDI